MGDHGTEQSGELEEREEVCGESGRLPDRSSLAGLSTPLRMSSNLGLDGSSSMDRLPWFVFHGSSSMDRLPWIVFHGSSSMDRLPWIVFQQCNKVFHKPSRLSIFESVYNYVFKINE